MLTVVADPEVTPATPAPSVSLIDDIVRDGARRMLAAALEAEVAAYITRTPLSFGSAPYASRTAVISANLPFRRPANSLILAHSVQER